MLLDIEMEHRYLLSDLCSVREWFAWAPIVRVHIY